jgi:hypothetical protein
MTNSSGGSSIVDGVLWWLCLFVVPMVLVGIELFHPAGFTHEPGMWTYLSEPQPYDAAHKALAYAGPQWWFTLNMIQTPMVGMVAVGLWRMVSAVGSGDGGRWTNGRQQLRRNAHRAFADRSIASANQNRRIS